LRILYKLSTYALVEMISVPLSNITKKAQLVVNVQRRYKTLLNKIRVDDYKMDGTQQ
jgi:hypothetical protein